MYWEISSSTTMSCSESYTSIERIVQQRFAVTFAFLCLGLTHTAQLYEMRALTTRIPASSSAQAVTVHLGMRR